MNSAIIRQLVLADLYLLRWMIVGAVAGGAGAIAVMPLGRVPAYVGSVLLICVLIILNIFLVMSGIVQERKDKVQVFVLSLPISPMQYTARQDREQRHRVRRPVASADDGHAGDDPRHVDPGREPFLTVAAILGYLLMLLLRAAGGRAGVGFHGMARRCDHVSETCRSTSSSRFSAACRP